MINWFYKLNKMISDILTGRIKQIDKAKFFDLYRGEFGKISQSQVDALNTFIDLTNQNISQLIIKQWAYAYATTYHETDKTFKPVVEAYYLDSASRRRYYETMYDPVLGKDSKRRQMAIDNGNTSKGDGVLFPGQGYVQITWKNNYKKQSDNATDYFGHKIDFVANPELCLDPKYAFFNLWYGMKYGIYTGRKIGDYISTLTVDYINARIVINGTDEAQKIANYAKSFEYILENSII